MARSGLIAAVLLLSFSSAQGALASSRSSSPEDTPEFTLRATWSLIEVSSDPGVQDLLRGLNVDVEGGDRDSLHVSIRPEDLPLLDTLGVAYQVLHEDLSVLKPTSTEERGASYHDADGVVFVLQALADEYPEIARYIELGRSWEGRPIAGLLLTDTPEIREMDEPSMRLLGGHHGDEYSSVEVTIDIAWTLAERYKQGDEDVQSLLDSREVWIAPLVNPDGHTEFTRRNSRDVDLNRNYSYLWTSSGASGESPFSEVETQAVRQLSIARSFDHSISVHSGATNLGWVWNSDYDATPEEPWMEGLCTDYLTWTQDPEFWVTNGADWYISFGDTNDWSYGVRGGHDYTLEVSEEKTPPEEDLNEVLSFHTDASIRFLSGGAVEGLLLRFTDSLGRGLEATVTGTESGWKGFSDPETGAFARPLPSGVQSVTISAHGYNSQVLDLESTLNPDLQVVILSSHPDTTPTRIEGANLSLEGSSEFAICSARLAETEGEVDVLLSREGDEPPTGVRGATELGTPCVSVTLSAEQLVPEGWRREGEWNVIVEGESGEALALLPNGILISSNSPGYTVTSVVIENEDAAPNPSLMIAGTNLPRGALVRAIGPDGSRAFPVGRADNREDNSYQVEFDVSNWAEGPWSLRLFGAGHWLELSQVLLLEDGLLSVVENELPTEPDDPPPDEPDDSGRLGLTGCLCVNQGNISSSEGVSSLVLALLVGYSRRRRRTWS